MRPRSVKVIVCVEDANGSMMVISFPFGTPWVFGGSAGVSPTKIVSHAWRNGAMLLVNGFWGGTGGVRVELGVSLAG